MAKYKIWVTLSFDIDGCRAESAKHKAITILRDLLGEGTPEIKFESISAENLDGQIADVKVYSHTLSAEEIEKDYGQKS